jgi:hypothetical protein
MRVGVLSHRLDIAIARKDRASAEKALNDLIVIDRIPEDVARDFDARYQKANWD